MKMQTPTLQLLLAFIVIFSACRKDVQNSASSTPSSPASTDSIQKAANTIPFPQSVIAQCQYAPNYGDSILYPQPTNGQDYVVLPVNNLGISGQYFAWPDGLSINATTGAINVTTSISGIRYATGFVKSGTTDTCLSQLIIGGTSYADSVYALSQTTISANPYMNGNPYGPNICQQSGPNDGNKCKFDLYNNAKFQGIMIDKKMGFIDFEKSMKSMMFGPVPFDGEIVYSTFYYRVDDNTNNVPQQMQIEFIYYTSQSQIPAALLTQIGNKLSNILNNVLIATGSSPKPPLIIITRN